MRGAALRSLDPADVLAIATAAHEAEVGGLAGIPRPVDAAGFDLLLVELQRDRIEHDVVLGDREVMQHAHIGHLDPGIPHLLAGGGELEHVDVVGVEALGLVAEGDHVAGLRIELRMRGEGRALQLAIEAVHRIDRGQRVQIHRGGRAVFLQREQHAVVMDDVRVVRAAALALDAGVVHVRVAVHGEQQLAGLLLRHIALVAHEAALVADVAVLEAEQADMAFAIEGNVAGAQRVLRIRAGAIERRRSDRSGILPSTSQSVMSSSTRNSLRPAGRRRAITLGDVAATWRSGGGCRWLLGAGSGRREGCAHTGSGADGAAHELASIDGNAAAASLCVTSVCWPLMASPDGVVRASVAETPAGGEHGLAACR